jgi:hypothetical protein
MTDIEWRQDVDVEWGFYTIIDKYGNIQSTPPKLDYMKRKVYHMNQEQYKNNQNQNQSQNQSQNQNQSQSQNQNQKKKEEEKKITFKKNPIIYLFHCVNFFSTIMNSYKK